MINLTQRSYAYMRPGVGFHGVLDNVDFSGDPGIDHLTIDKSPRVQAEALRYVLETAHDQACRPAGAGPIVARPETPKETPKDMPKAALSKTPKQSRRQRSRLQVLRSQPRRPPRRCGPASPADRHRDAIPLQLAHVSPSLRDRNVARAAGKLLLVAQVIGGNLQSLAVLERNRARL